MFRGLNPRSKVHLSDLGVRKEVANCCLLFKNCKAKSNIHPMYLTKGKVGRGQKGRSKVQLIKTQQAMCKRLTLVVEINQVECV